MNAVTDAQLDKAEQGLRPLLKTFVHLYFLALGAMTAFFSLRMMMRNDSWTIGDWLINFQGGFVRRGIVGELIYQLHQFTGIAPKFFAMACHFIFYGLFLFFSWALIKRQKYILPLIPFLIAPISFTYQIHATAGGFRKEIMYLALLAIVAYIASVCSKERLSKVFVGVCIVYPLVILSHEMTAFLLPYIVAIYLLKQTQFAIKDFVKLSLLLVPSVIAFALAFVFQGGEPVAEAIRNSWGAYMPTEEGAIDWMGFDAKFGHEQVIKSIAEQDYVSRHIRYFLLSLLAFIPLIPRLRALLKQPLSLTMVLVSLAGMTALSVVAIDWGRFMYLSFISLFMVMLCLPEESRTQRFVLAYALSLGRLDKWVLGFAVAIFALVYGLGWYVPHCCDWSPYTGDLTRKIMLIFGIQL